MKQLTNNEICRTAFKAITKSEFKSQYGYTHPNRDHNEMCVYCKNEDTEVILDMAHLAPFKKFYGDKSFKVVNCHYCNSVFSIYLT